MSSFWNLFFAFAVLLLMQCVACLGMSKFTNIQCSTLDGNFTEFVECRMRAVKRDVNELTVRVKLLHSPMTDVSMRWQLLKKASGYKPFLYDVHAELCEYLERRNHPFINIIFDAFVGNHSIGNGIRKCPLDSEIALENFGFPAKMLEALPLPFGEYALFATFATQNAARAVVKIYFMLAEF